MGAFMYEGVLEKLPSCAFPQDVLDSLNESFHALKGGSGLLA